MKKLFLLSLALISIVFISGCGKQNGTHIPSTDFTISPNHVDITSNKFSNIVTVEVTKTENDGEQSNFSIRLTPLTNDIYIVSVNNNQTITADYPLRSLTDSGAHDELQFKVFGRIADNHTSVNTGITAQLIYNNSQVEGKLLPLSITILK